jgi:hypothetical protein
VPIGSEHARRDLSHVDPEQTGLNGTRLLPPPGRHIDDVDPCATEGGAYPRDLASRDGAPREHSPSLDEQTTCPHRQEALEHHGGPPVLELFPRTGPRPARGDHEPTLEHAQPCVAEPSPAHELERVPLVDVEPLDRRSGRDRLLAHGGMMNDGETRGWLLVTRSRSATSAEAEAQVLVRLLRSHRQHEHDEGDQPRGHRGPT